MQLRPITIVGDLAYVPLTQGKTAVISAEDVPLVEDRNWYTVEASGIWYAVSSARPSEGGNNKRIHMHRVLAGATPGLLVDHRDGNGLNNRRENLRVSTASENNRNRQKPVHNTSGFKGVVKVSANRWRAQITTHGKYVYLGSFATPEGAYAEYCRASVELHGVFGRTTPFPSTLT